MRSQGNILSPTFWRRGRRPNNPSFARAEHVHLMQFSKSARWEAQFVVKDIHASQIQVHRLLRERPYDRFHRGFHDGWIRTPDYIWPSVYIVLGDVHKLNRVCPSSTISNVCAGCLVALMGSEIYQFSKRRAYPADSPESPCSYFMSSGKGDFITWMPRLNIASNSSSRP